MIKTENGLETEISVESIKGEQKTKNTSNEQLSIMKEKYIHKSLYFVIMLWCE